MEEYFKGSSLYGDDFPIEKIEKWYKEEEEAYSNLGSKDRTNYFYGYHALNILHGFNKIKKTPHFENTLGFGSAWGVEFEPILNKLQNITIIDPSDNLISNKIGNIKPNYVKPAISGKLDFQDNSFDLITCFGTLHHIPNVTFVTNELIRVLKPGGYLLIREPIISMGDWRNPRNGLTKNERGIPVKVFDTIFSKKNITVISKNYCFTMLSIFQGLLGRLLPKPIYSYTTYLYFDKFISSLFKSNIHYHATKKLERISPQSIFYVIKKTS